MTLLYSTHPLMSTMLQGPSYRTPKRPATEMERRTSTSTSSDVPRPFRPDRGYEVTGIVDSGPSDDDDKEKSPPRRANVPEEERRSEMKHQARRSHSPVRHTSQWDNRKPQEEEKKKSPTRPPRGPNTYKKTYNTGSADRIHRNSRDY